MNQLSGLMDNIMAVQIIDIVIAVSIVCLLYTSPSPRDTR